MDIRNCKECGKIYKYDGFNICINCRKKEEEYFTKVKDFIYDNPGATIQIVSEETGVPQSKILRYLREGRLELADEDNLILSCERCGKGIKSGRFCNMCKVELEREFKSSIAEKTNTFKKTDKDKMYVAERYKKY